ncbi:MAG: hypothetical protein WCT18_03185 [Patescibacteria group bacterium]
MNEVLAKLKEMDERFATQDKRFDKQDKRLDRIEKRLDDLTIEVVNHSERLQRIEENMVTKMDFNILLGRMDEMLVLFKKRDLAAFLFV